MIGSGVRSISVLLTKVVVIEPMVKLVTVSVFVSLALVWRTHTREPFLTVPVCAVKLGCSSSQLSAYSPFSISISTVTVNPEMDTVLEV